MSNTYVSGSGQRRRRTCITIAGWSRWEKWERCRYHENRRYRLPQAYSEAQTPRRSGRDRRHNSGPEEPPRSRRGKTELFRPIWTTVQTTFSKWIAGKPNAGKQKQIVLSQRQKRRKRKHQATGNRQRNKISLEIGPGLCYHNTTLVHPYPERTPIC